VPIWVRRPCAQIALGSHRVEEESTMIERPQLITESGASVSDNEQSQTAGPDGPVLVQDMCLLEKPARFSRERITE
jgi:catalase